MSVSMKCPKCMQVHRLPGCPLDAAPPTARNEMIERVADAIYDAAAGDAQSPGISDRLAALLARAAIVAMREPTEGMLKAGAMPMVNMPLGNGTMTKVPGLGAGPYSMWPRMIDAALEEPPKPE